MVWYFIEEIRLIKPKLLLLQNNELFLMFERQFSLFFYETIFYFKFTTEKTTDTVKIISAVLVIAVKTNIIVYEKSALTKYHLFWFSNNLNNWKKELDGC